MICNAEKIAELIKKANKIALVCHANPDGDTLGSGLALYYALKGAGKQTDIFCSDVPGRKLRTLYGAENLRTDMPNQPYELAIAVDCSDINLLSAHAGVIRRARVSACVDHHMSNSDYTKYTYVERGVAACAQPVYKLIKLISGGKPLDVHVAGLLYTALVTDSGGFAFSSVTGDTLRIAAELLDCGVQGHKITEYFMQDISPAVYALKTRVLARTEFFEDGRIGMITFNASDFAASGTALSDTTGIINDVRNVEGVDVAVAVTEAALREYKVSIRTDEKADANRIAAVFGGGGHNRAAGCRVFGEYEDVKERVLKACRDHLE